MAAVQGERGVAGSGEGEDEDEDDAWLNGRRDRHVVYMSDKERGEVDMRGKTIVRRCRDRVAAMEVGEKGECYSYCAGCGLCLLRETQTWRVGWTKGRYDTSESGRAPLLAFPWCLMLSSSDTGTSRSTSYIHASYHHPTPTPTLTHHIPSHIAH